MLIEVKNLKELSAFCIHENLYSVPTRLKIILKDGNSYSYDGLFSYLIPQDNFSECSLIFLDFENMKPIYLKVRLMKGAKLDISDLPMELRYFYDMEKVSAAYEYAQAALTYKNNLDSIRTTANKYKRFFS